MFHVNFSATPSANNIDAVVGLSSGAASSWTKLATIVRFSPDGIIDVRRGAAYSYSARIPYSGGTTYSIRLDVNVKTHRYSVYVGAALLAKDFEFRTEQASVTSLNNIASYLEPSRAGTLNVCNVNVVHDDSFANNCLASNAGGTFQNAQLTATSGVLVTRFNATPSAANMDGVVGFAQGAVDAYNDLAASVRFATNGNIEARDGDLYRADQPFPYRAGVLYRFQVIVDVPSKTYSVRVSENQNWEFVEIARSYKFRPQQANVTGLDHAATIVASTTGHVDACELTNQAWRGLKFAHHDWARSVLPLYNNNLAVVEETGTVITTANGVTLYRGAPAGVIAHDNSDNLYIATTSNGLLSIQSFTPTLAARSTLTYQIDGEPRSMNIWGDGTIAVNVDNRMLMMFHPDGSSGGINLTQWNPAAVAISRAGWGMVQIFPDGMQVDSFTTTGQRVFQRFWNGAFQVEAFVPHGQGFALSGQFYTTVDFGQGPMEPNSNEDTSNNTFLLSLTANGVVGFSKRLWIGYSTGLATDDNTHIAIAAQGWTQTPYWSFTVYDSAGNAVSGVGWTGADDSMGFAGTIAVASSGRAFVNLAPKWYPGFTESTWPHLFAFDGQ